MNRQSEDLQTEIDRLKPQVESLGREVEEIYERLKPVFLLRWKVKQQLISTYPQKDGRILYNPAGAKIRKDLFDQLTMIDDKFGRQKAELTKKRKLLKQYTTDLVRFTTAQSKATQRRTT